SIPRARPRGSHAAIGARSHPGMVRRALIVDAASFVASFRGDDRSCSRPNAAIGLRTSRGSPAISKGPNVIEWNRIRRAALVGVAGLTLTVASMAGVAAQDGEPFTPEGCWPQDAQIGSSGFPRWNTAPEMVI